MKQKIYITALLAGMLALAGCGGGGSSGSGDNGNGNGGGTKCDTDQTLDTATNTCKTNPPDPNAVNHEQARKDALALYNVLDSSSVNSSDNAIPNAIPNDNKGTQSFKSEIELSANNSGLTAIPGTLPDNLKGYFNVTGDGTAIKVTGFPSGSDEVTHTVGATITGAFKGVDGTFQCYAMNGCTSQSKGKDGFALAADQWRFKPDNAEAKIEGSAILEWGWWVTKSGDEITGASVGFDDDSLTSPTNISGLASTASYTGTALGKYAVVEKDTGSSGDFTAAAKLTADFDENMLTGTINAFKDADDADLGWTVKLESEVNEDNLSDGAFVDVGNDKNSVVWTHDGDDFTTENAWIATIYEGSGTSAPEYILGEFQANHLNARMIGAFGTKKDKQGN